jgi:hypothetical protein
VRGRIGALAVGLAVISAALAVPAPAAHAACAPDPLLCPQRIHVGASVDGLPGDPRSLDAFTQASGVSPSLAMYFIDFGGQVDTAAVQRLSATGRLPMMTWEPWIHTAPAASSYPMRTIASGEFDSYLKITGTTLTVKLPTQAPTGATGWQLTVGSVTRSLPLTTTSTDITGLTPGTSTPRSLRATAGTWNDQPGLSQPATGTVLTPE